MKSSSGFVVKKSTPLIPALRRTATYLRGLNQQTYEDLVKLMLAKTDQRIALSDAIDALADIEEACPEGGC